ncbi:TraB/GumN family protein [Algoriphagus jejuensis]|uniref:TraB/GumN family protein n=1 Tax=Algoriphagus jejuensis TaxID=419934 RepID=A0ABN1MUW0_9BACT
MPTVLLKKLVLLLHVLLFIWLPSFGQDNSLLWKVSGNGLQGPSYLFGTIHLICKEDFRIANRVEEAFEASEKIVMELDMSDPKLQSKMQGLSLNPGMKNISEDLDASEVKLINDFLRESYGVGLEQLGILKPFVLSTMVLMKSFPCEELEGYEVSFTSKAMESQKPIIGLETPEFQLGIFDQIPAEIQLSELIKIIQDQSAADDFRQLTAAYLREDTEALYDLMVAEAMMAEYREVLLDNRNKAWVSILANEMVAQSLFVAVGAGHLGGDQGLISLLRKAGYQVDPIRD